MRHSEDFFSVSMSSEWSAGGILHVHGVDTILYMGRKNETSGPTDVIPEIQEIEMVKN